MEQVKLFNRYCEFKGSNVAVAEVLGLTPSMVSALKRGERKIQPRFANLIEKDCQGMIKREDLVDWD